MIKRKFDRGDPSIVVFCAVEHEYSTDLDDIDRILLRDAENKNPLAGFRIESRLHDDKVLQTHGDFYRVVFVDGVVKQ